jgi:hypothetical protein
VGIGRRAVAVFWAQLQHFCQLVCLFVCLFVFYKGRPDQNQAQEQGSAAQCGVSRVNVRAAKECHVAQQVSNCADGGH